jgi:hypothetical protein
MISLDQTKHTSVLRNRDEPAQETAARPGQSAAPPAAATSPQPAGVQAIKGYRAVFLTPHYANPCPIASDFPVKCAAVRADLPTGSGPYAQVG